MDMTPQKPIDHSSAQLHLPSVFSGFGIHCLNGRTVEFGDQISKMQHLDHREMAGVRLEQLLLLVFYDMN